VIFTDQNHCQAGAGTACGKRFGAGLEIGAQLLCQHGAVEDFCGHRGFQEWPGEIWQEK
jgi:hypothetical protein